MRSRISATDRFAVALLLALLVWHGCEAEAQELPDVSLPCAPELTVNRRAVLEHEGASGVWFHLQVARCMLGRLAALPRYVERVGLLQERLQIGEDRTELLRRQVTLAETEAERATAVLEEAVRGRRQAQERVEFERSLRWVWFGVGVVVVAALGGLSLWASE